MIGFGFVIIKKEHIEAIYLPLNNAVYTLNLMELLTVYRKMKEA